jgi:hypothetical protein
MIEAGVDLCADLSVENADLYALAELLYRRLALANRGQLVRKFELMARVRQQELFPKP